MLISYNIVIILISISMVCYIIWDNYKFEIERQKRWKEFEELLLKAELEDAINYEKFLLFKQEKPKLRFIKGGRDNNEP